LYNFNIWVKLMLSSDNAIYSISTVSAMTGVNAVTLRAWESRYGLISPTRTNAGHRLYAEEDIERIKLILTLLDEGIAISRVKEALRIAAEREVASPPDDQGPWEQFQRDMLNAVDRFDEATLERIYNESMSLYPVEVVTRQLLIPLLEMLGERWMKSDTGIAEEHFFSVFMRNKLGARFHHRNLQNTGRPACQESNMSLDCCYLPWPPMSVAIASSCLDPICHWRQSPMLPGVPKVRGSY
jgi:DNA-binding transcriptional MerR regulator